MDVSFKSSLSFWNFTRKFREFTLLKTFYFKINRAIVSVIIDDPNLETNVVKLLSKLNRYSWILHSTENFAIYLYYMGDPSIWEKYSNLNKLHYKIRFFKIEKNTFKSIKFWSLDIFERPEIQNLDTFFR